MGSNGHWFRVRWGHRVDIVTRLKWVKFRVDLDLDLLKLNQVYIYMRLVL